MGLGLIYRYICLCVCFQNTVDKLIKKTNLALVVGSCSWREQFVSAVTVSAGQLLSAKLCSRMHK